MHIHHLPRLLRRSYLILLTALFSSTFAIAQTPAYVYNPSTVIADTVSLGSTTYNAAQYLFTAADFSPSVPTGGGMIAKVYIKAATAQSAGSTINLRFDFGAVTSTTLSSSAWTLGMGTVYSASTTLAGWSAGDWIPVSLSTPVFWDGSSDFVLNVIQTGFSNPLELAHGSISTRTARTYGDLMNTVPSGADDKLISLGIDFACSGTPSVANITTAAFAANAPMCSGGTKTIAATFPDSPIPDGISYQWESSSSASGPWASVSGGTGATTLSYTTPALTASTYYRLAVICSHSTDTSYSNTYLVPVGSGQPASISGPSAVCSGDTLKYSVVPEPGTTYTWTLPTGWIGTSTADTILVVASANSGNISVSASPACLGTTAPTLAITTTSKPTTPGTLLGNTLICGGTTQTYSILPVSGATSYIWTLPSGWSGSSTTTSITVTAGSNSGTITVRAANGCGQSSNATPLNVTIMTSLPSPGAISGLDTVCSGTLQGYTVNAVPGATTYSWTLPSGWSGTTSTNSIQVFAGSSGGSISVTASSACASSPATSKTLAVIATVTPGVSISAPATAVCEHSPVTFLATPVNGGSAPSYQWKKNGTNVTGTAGSYTDNTLTSSDVITVTMTSNAACAAGAIVSSNPASANIVTSVMPGVSINTTPPISICKGTPVTFTTTSNGTGSTPGYQWFKNGVAISGATGTSYSDPSLNHGDTLSVQMTTSAQCPVVPVAHSNKVGVSVTNPAISSVSIAVSPSDYITPGQQLTFTATYSNGGATPDFQWQKNGVNIPFATGDTYVSSDVKPGDHFAVKMLSYAPCVTNPYVASNTIILKSSNSNVGIAGSEAAAPGISIYPNPNSGRFSIAATGWTAAFSGRQVRVDVINMTGQLVHHLDLVPGTIGGNSWQTQLSLDQSLANGRYMLQVSTDDGSFRATVPFILNK